MAYRVGQIPNVTLAVGTGFPFESTTCTDISRLYAVSFWTELIKVEGPIIIEVAVPPIVIFVIAGEAVPVRAVALIITPCPSAFELNEPEKNLVSATPIALV
jgi:hypothetical protein